MKVFISWSGERSRQVAEALYNWLPNVIQAIQPWMSANDIEKGTRWRSGLANELEQSRVSIICLTPENLEAPWINFEAGASAKQQQNTFACTFLFGLEPIDVREPLAQFQATKAEKEDIFKFVHTINRAREDSPLSEGKINEAFDVWWPKLEQRLNSIPALDDSDKEHRRLAISAAYESLDHRLDHQRDVREILGEILALVREQSRENRRETTTKSHFRFPIWATVSKDDERLLSNYYLHLKDPILKDLIANNEVYAQLVLEILKDEQLDISSRKKGVAEIVPETHEEDEIDEDTDS